jgi:hypothetical protein
MHFNTRIISAQCKNTGSHCRTVLFFMRKHSFYKLACIYKPIYWYIDTYRMHATNTQSTHSNPNIVSVLGFLLDRRRWTYRKFVMVMLCHAYESRFNVFRVTQCYKLSYHSVSPVIFYWIWNIPDTFHYMFY